MLIFVVTHSSEKKKERKKSWHIVTHFRVFIVPRSIHTFSISNELKAYPFGKPRVRMIVVVINFTLIVQDVGLALSCKGSCIQTGSQKPIKLTQFMNFVNRNSGICHTFKHLIRSSGKS
jgi:hypothetical protein